VAAMRQGLITAQQLCAQTRQEIEAFIALCQDQERIDLPLLLDPEPPADNDETLYFLYYRDDRLVGAASTWPGQEIEVIGAVHPDHRRKGIGRALLDALIQESRKRGAESLLLVCEKSVPSGAAFAHTMGAQYEFGEYRMELDRALYARCPTPPQTLDVKRADRTAQDALVALLSTSREIDAHAARKRVIDWLAEAHQRFYIGWLEDRAAGMIRLHQGASSVFLYSFLVHPDLRGRGYGRQILMGVLDALIAEDWPHIMIEVATDNRVALALYRSCGYREVAAYQYYRLAVEPL
jgi:ribosomal protein S18 acetylase RimI-like enzyme